MTTSQHPRRGGGPWALARARRDLYNEQVYAWECFFRSGLPPQPRAQAPARARAGHAAAGSGSLVPADASSGNQTAGHLTGTK
jgi:hypothetical protein